MKTVAEREIDDAIPAAERDGRLCAVCGQGMEARSRASCQYDTDGLVLHEPTLVAPVAVSGLRDEQIQDRGNSGLNQGLHMTSTGFLAKWSFTEALKDIEAP